MTSGSTDLLGFPRPLVYIGMCCDLIHHGHIALIVQARIVGHVIAGLLTDAAIASYKQPPTLPYAARHMIVSEIRGVELVVPQHTLSYRDNLTRYRPEFVMHGDDWRRGVQEGVREEVIGLLQEWGGQLIEVPYTQGISSGQLRERLFI